MHKQRIYIDTSVIGGCFDIEFEEWSNKLIDEIRSGLKLAVISDVVLEELEGASNNIKEIINNLPVENVIIVLSNNESDDLAKQYIESKVISPKFADDAQHVALATINNVDVLVSWNFKHLVNYNRIMRFNSINLLNGYKQLEIRSPKEVLNHEEEF